MWTELARLYLLAEFFKIQAADALKIQLDLSPIEHVVANRKRYAVLDEQSGAHPQLADLVNPVVLDERGQLWPLAYGMAADQRIAAGDTEQWFSDVDAYLRLGAQPLRDLLTSGLRQLEAADDVFVDWYAFLVGHSHDLAKV